MESNNNQSLWRQHRLLNTTSLTMITCLFNYLCEQSGGRLTSLNALHDHAVLEHTLPLLALVETHDAWNNKFDLKKCDVSILDRRSVLRRKSTHRQTANNNNNRKKRNIPYVQSTSYLPLTKPTGLSPAMPVIFTFIQSPRGRLRWNTLIFVLFTCKQHDTSRIQCQ